MFFRISTSSVCNAALVIRLRIFIIFTIASWRERGGRRGKEGEQEKKEDHSCGLASGFKSYKSSRAPT